MCLGGSGRGDDLLVCGLRAPVADIVADRPAKEHRFLEGDANVATQHILCHIAHVDAVDRHPALGDVVKARNQVDQARLARSGSAENGHGLARLGHKAEAPEHRIVAVAVIAKGHPLKSHPSLRGKGGPGIRTALDLGFAVQHFLDALRRGLGAGHAHGQHANKEQRHQRAHQIVDKGDDLSDLHVAEGDLHAAEPDGPYDAQIEGQHHDRPGHGNRPHGANHLLHQALVRRPKASHLVLGADKSLDHPHTGQVLLHHRVQIVELALDLAEHGIGFADDPEYGDHYQRHQGDQ